MKWLLSKDGGTRINPRYVREIVVNERVWLNKPTTWTVMAIYMPSSKDNYPQTRALKTFHTKSLAHEYLLTLELD